MTSRPWRKNSRASAALPALHTRAFEGAPGSRTARIVQELLMAIDDPRRVRREDGIPSWAERLVLFLDDGFVIPRTNFRVGFDAVLGLIPGVGDFLTTASGLSLVWLAQQRGAPKAVVGRMMLNLGVDALVGAVPLVGDVFDVVFKANRRNLQLLQRYDRAPVAAARSDVLYLSLVVAGVVLLLTVPVVLAILIVRLLVG